MKILTRYLIKEMLGPLLFGIFAFTAMFLGMAFINLLREFESYHVSITVLLRFLALTLPQNVMYGTAIATLLATLLGLGNLTGHSETIAMRTGGLSYFNLAVPVLLIGLAVSISGVFLNEYAVPMSLRAYQKLRLEITSNKVEATIYNFKQNFYNKQGYLEKIVYAQKYESQLQQLQGVIIVEVNHGAITRTIETAMMYWKGDRWYFSDGAIWQYSTSNLFPIKFKRVKVHYPLSLTPAMITQMNEPPERKSISELNRYIKTVPEGVDRRRLLVELHTKLAIPFASFVFALLGTPLALRPQRRSNAAGFGLCIIFIVLWYTFFGIGTSMAKSGLLSPFLGTWLANFILAGYGFFVFSKVKS